MSATAATVPESDLEQDTYHRIAWRLIPFLFLLYVVNFLDRVNVGYAKLQMGADLGFSDTVYGFGAGLFFIGYFFLEIPSNLMLERFGARIWIARILVIWGLISAAFMFVRTPNQFYLMRLLLGVGEAGFFPGIILYLTYWFPGPRRARMVALFMSAIAVAGVVGGPMSGWIMKACAGWNGWAGWQWLFLIEGIPAVLLGIATLFHLDDRPEGARWLSPEARALVARQLEAERQAKAGSGDHAALGAALRDGKVWALVMVYFCNVIAFYGVSFFLPQLIKDMGVTDVLKNGLISAIPWSVAAVVMILNARHSDRTLERRWHVAVPSLCAAAGLATAATLGGASPVAGLIALTVTTAGSLCVPPVFWSLPTAFLSGRAQAGSIALINSCGALGGFFGPSLVGIVRDLTGSPAYALYVLSGFFVLCGMIVVVVFGAGAVRGGAGMKGAAGA